LLYASAKTTWRHQYARPPRITLKHLNRIKRQRKIHKIAHDKKLAVLPIIYGDPDQQAEESKMDLERKAFELETARERFLLDIERGE